MDGSTSNSTTTLTGHWSVHGGFPFSKFKSKLIFFRCRAEGASTAPRVPVGIGAVSLRGLRPAATPSSTRVIRACRAIVPGSCRLKWTPLGRIVPSVSNFGPIFLGTGSESFGSSSNRPRTAKDPAERPAGRFGPSRERLETFGTRASSASHLPFRFRSV